MTPAQENGLAAIHAAMQHTIMEIYEKDKGLLHPIYCFTALSVAAAEEKALGNLLIAKGIITQDEYYEHTIARIEQEIHHLRESAGLDAIEIMLI